MRILALDHGSARCGCAISDPTGTVITPLPVIERPDTAAGRASIVDCVQTNAVERVLVGLPRLQSGEEGAQAAAARSFAGRLGAELGVAVVLFDERFTTRMAQSSIADGATASEDSLAAAHLLEEYLESIRPERETG